MILTPQEREQLCLDELVNLLKRHGCVLHGLPQGVRSGWLRIWLLKHLASNHIDVLIQVMFQLEAVKPDAS